MTKNLFHDSCLTFELGYLLFITPLKIFLTQLEGQTRIIKQILCHSARHKTNANYGNLVFD